MSPIISRSGFSLGFGRRRGGGPAFSATGGTVTTYNDKTIHTFTGSGTFTVTAAPPTFSVEYVVVAGGGGGAHDYGGGGGAGGYRTGSTPVGAPVSIQVGAGGLQSNTGTISPNGEPSFFGTPITAAGGGSGAPDGLGPGGSGLDGGNAGGSGGGNGLDSPGTRAAGNTPAVSPSQGNPGGLGTRGGVPIGGGGGGGGAGGAGADWNDGGGGGVGGIGVQIPTTFRNPTAPVGTPGPAGAFYLAGGGSAGNPAYPGAGGSGGGGNTGSAGGTNTGGGGGGNYQSSAGSGGSGIVIIAYPS